MTFQSLKVDEPVEVVEYTNEWAITFQREHDRLRIAVGPDVHIEHIGSTAVPGMIAKPIIDIALGMNAFPPSAGLIKTVCELGYESLGEAGVPGRHYFRYRGIVNFNVHAMQVNGSLWANNLVLRDYLRSSPAARERYAAAKREAVASGHTMLLAYSSAKGALLLQLLQEAYAADE